MTSLISYVPGSVQTHHRRGIKQGTQLTGSLWDAMLDSNATNSDQLYSWSRVSLWSAAALHHGDIHHFSDVLCAMPVLVVGLDRDNNPVDAMTDVCDRGDRVVAGRIAIGSIAADAERIERDRWLREGPAIISPNRINRGPWRQ